MVRLLSVQLVRFGPTAISSTAVLSTLGSSNPVSSTNKYLDFKVRLASIHYFLVTLWKTLYGIHFQHFTLWRCVKAGINDFIAYFEHTWLGDQFTPAKWNVYSEKGTIE